MPICGEKLTPVKHKRAIGMSNATVTPSVVTKQFRCHVRTIGRLKNRFQQTWTTPDRPRPGRPCVLTRRQDPSETMAARGCNNLLSKMLVRF